MRQREAHVGGVREREVCEREAEGGSSRLRRERAECWFKTLTPYYIYATVVLGLLVGFGPVFRGGPLN